MKKFNLFGILALSCALQTLPIYSNTEVLNKDSMTDEAIADKDYGKNSCNKSLTLKDFAGAWTISADSIGGVAGPTAVGHSATFDGQVTFDKNGNGTVNFLSGVEYAGTKGSINVITFSGVTITLTITDPINGIGVLTVTDTTPPFNDTADIIVTRSLSTGQAIEIEGHGTGSDAETTFIVAYSLKRQYQ